MAVAYPSTSIQINEVVSSGGTPDDWIEFYNSGTQTFDLSGFRVQDDSEKNPYFFAEGTSLAPGEYLVIDTVKKSVGDFDFGLGAEDKVRLFDAAGTQIDEVQWTAHGEPSWGRLAEGALAATASVTKGAANVFPGEGDGGSGEGGSGSGEGDGGSGSGVPHASGLRVNEIIYDKASGYEPDQVEIYNTGTEPVVLNGWEVADDKNREPLPDGIVIEAGKFFVLLNGTHFSFGLGKGDAFWLYDASGALVDGYAYENTAPLMTWARCIDGTGDWAWATVVTPGQANVCAPLETPGSVVLNEIDSQPADWVELYNPGSVDFDLGGFEIRDNSDDHRWQFAAGTAITGGGFLVVGETTTGRVYDDKTQTWNIGLFPEAIGIGGADEIRLYNPAGELIDRSGAWTSHAAIDGDMAAATLARCVDGEGEFMLAHPTPGAPNNCVALPVVINEVESNGDASDWVEIMNIGAEPVDISGWTLIDNDPVGHAAETTPLAAGTVLAPGAFYVFDQPRDFVFGLGGGDTATVRNAAGVTVAEYTWTSHANGVYARCVNGTGEFRDLEVSTKGIENACGNPVRINEVVTNPDDWVELVNPTSRTLDISGIIVKDDDDSHSYTIPNGTEIAAGGYFVIEGGDLGFGLGKADSLRLFEGENLINSTSWGPEHPLPSWGRCVDTSGSFAVTAEATKGAPNFCVGQIVAEVWPGDAATRTLDQTPTFLSDSSGLDVQETAEGTFLWAVDNGTGTFWKLAVRADGSVVFADGWQDGKRARFQKDAGNPSAAGPDAEGITVAGDGFIYIASERDNSAKGVNYNTVLKVDPNAAGPDVVAAQEWDLTRVLPAVGANLGIEAVEWVADSDLHGKLWDRNTNAPYDSADYSGHGNGLFFVGIEDQGQVFAVALLASGEARIVAELTAGLGGVMALDYDRVLGVLWAVCDDGCAGTAAQFTLNGTAAPDVTHVLRPGGLPDVNHEGFATAPASLAANGKRPAWWFADGYESGALSLGVLNYRSSGGGNDGGGNNGGGNNGGGNGGSDAGSGTPSSSALNDSNRGSVQAPNSAAAGSTITITVGAQYNGTEVTVWLFSTPVKLGSATVVNGQVQVKIPAGIKAEAHRLAVYAADGTLIGWTNLTVTEPLAKTGSERAPVQLLAAGAALMLLAGLAWLAARRSSAKRETVEIES